MATAKRVKQEDAQALVRRSTTTQRFTVTVTDGVEIARTPIGTPVTSTFVTPEFTPRPDIILLEMSVEEARSVRNALCGQGCYAAYAALDTALSPNAGTQTSPTKDVGCGGALAGYTPEGLYQR